ncbi:MULTISPECIES: O-antigen ligase family protein [Sphingobacterium]|uniref:O-antigen ligase family protein n=1 Tax=Sphingobacterium TaxID=28453 RepID=UPI00257F87DE|nr:MULTISPECIES: O-antigen ligase family protein [Sphingobacterium]
MTEDILVRNLGLKVLAVIGCALITFLSVSGGLLPGVGFALLPFLICFLIVCIRNPFISFLFLFTVCFFVMGILRYTRIPVPPSIVVDLVILFNFIVIGLNHLYGNYNSKFKIPLYFFVSLAWAVYCTVEVFNPQNVLSNWFAAIRSTALYLCLFQFLVYYIFKDKAKVRYFFIFWAILVLLGAIKAIGQKFIGFDTDERIWLYTLGAHTHLIYSGVRYFSFFTDAANFGCHMGLGMVVFSILFLYEKNNAVRIFYIFVALLAMYGMLISGTRSAMAIPLAGYAFYIVLLKQWRLTLMGSTLFVIIFCFLSLTNIGNNNADIRRMRTAFQFKDDASFNLRKENQAKMQTFMRNYPIGLGLGAAKNAGEGDLLNGLPTDTSFVFVWVETGIVGLIVYLFVWLSCLAICFYFVWFRLRDTWLRGICSAAGAGIAGMMAAGYGNEVLHQFPTGETIYILMATAMLCPYLQQNEQNRKQILS